MQVITFPDAPEWTQNVKLDGKSYRLRARWNTSSEAWSMDVLTTSKTLLVSGLRMVRGAALIGQFQNDDLPPGDFIVYDTGERVDEYSDFTEGLARLVYVTEDEVAELESDDD